MKRWTIVFAATVLIVVAALAFQKAKAVTSGPAKPDLIVDQKRLLQNWVVRDEKLSANACSVEEGELHPANTSSYASLYPRPTSALLIW